ncbi:MAG: lysophospholipid acyltransferase family protein [Candidatus Sedimenticola endophacoides]
MENNQTTWSGVREGFYSFSSWLLQNLVYYTTRLYLKYVKRCRLDLVGEARGRAGPVVFVAAPHLLHLDVVLVPCAIPRGMLPLRWLADEKIYTGPLKGLWLRLWGAIKVKRHPDGGFDPEDVEQVLGHATAGKRIGIFPECCLVGGRFSGTHRGVIGGALGRGFTAIPVSLSGVPLPETRTSWDGKPLQVVVAPPLREYAELMNAFV